MRRRSERGQSAVEFALVIPAMLLFLLGIFQIGITFFDNESLQTSARDGARAGAIHTGATLAQIQAYVDAAVRANAVRARHQHEQARGHLELHLPPSVTPTALRPGRHHRCHGHLPVEDRGAGLLEERHAHHAHEAPHGVARDDGLAREAQEHVCFQGIETDALCR